MEEPFEIVLINFDPLIKSLVKRYSFHLEFDDMYQIGRIALWEAYEKYDQAKGHFPAYASRCVSGRLLQAINKRSVDTVQADEHSIDQQHSLVVPFLEDIIIGEYVKNLSKREELYVKYIILQQGNMMELAKMEGVSYETVRSWRKNALSKLRIKKC